MWGVAGQALRPVAEVEGCNRLSLAGMESGTLLWGAFNFFSVVSDELLMAYLMASRAI